MIQASVLLAFSAALYLDHPGLAHYIIHAYDHPPLAARALGADLATAQDAYWAEQVDVPINACSVPARRSPRP